MKIQYLGHSCFEIKNREVSVITDPFDPKLVGLKFPKIEADVVTVSHGHTDHNYVAGVGVKPVVFDYPGDYEVKGVKIFGLQSWHDKTRGSERGENIIFKIVIDGIVVTHLGDLGEMPSRELLEELEDTDILLIPVGGTFTINAAEAAEIVKAIKPAVTIPMHYQVPKLNPAEFAALSDPGEFLKLLGKAGIAPVSRFEAKNEEELPENEVLLLEAAK